MFDILATLAQFFFSSPTFDTIAAEITIIDGDTIRVATTSYRIATIDAPELFSPRCEHERTLGAAAKAELSDIIRSANQITIKPDKLDRFGRTIARVLIDGSDISDLIATSRVLRPVRNTRPMLRTPSPQQPVPALASFLQCPRTALISAA